VSAFPTVERPLVVSSALLEGIRDSTGQSLEWARGAVEAALIVEAEWLLTRREGVTPGGIRWKSLS
jgi:hypothetical protein